MGTSDKVEDDGGQRSAQGRGWSSGVNIIGWTHSLLCRGGNHYVSCQDGEQPLCVLRASSLQSWVRVQGQVTFQPPAPIEMESTPAPAAADDGFVSTDSR